MVSHIGIVLNACRNNGENNIISIIQQLESLKKPGGATGEGAASIVEEISTYCWCQDHEMTSQDSSCCEVVFASA